MTAAVVWSGLAVAAVGHGFLWTGAVNRLHGLKGPRPLIDLLTWASIAAFAVIPVLIVRLQILAGAVWLQPSADDVLTPEGLAAAYLCLTLAIGALALPMKQWIERRRYDRSVLRQWTAETRDVAAALGHKPLRTPLATLLGSLPLNEAIELSIDRKRLVLPRLPEELAGLTIAHLSDLHMTGGIDRDYFGYLACQVNDLRPDVIAVTGDIIENEECWPWLEESLGRLCAPLGVYYVLGNHDLFINAERTREILAELGLISLSGRWLRTDWNGAPVALCGNELPWLPAAPVEISHSKHRPDRPEFRMALCHTPDQFAWCQRADVDLALAGHTHGGQVQLPLLGVVASPSLYGTRYACGVFRRGATVLHVSRGIGGETPLRWRCPPEAALLELMSAEIGS